MAMRNFFPLERGDNRRRGLLVRIAEPAVRGQWTAGGFRPLARGRNNLTAPRLYPMLAREKRRTGLPFLSLRKPYRSCLVRIIPGAIGWMLGAGPSSAHNLCFERMPQSW